jgi:hypothetical protein
MAVYSFIDVCPVYVLAIFQKKREPDKLQTKYEHFFPSLKQNILGSRTLIAPPMCHLERLFDPG